MYLAPIENKQTLQQRIFYVCQTLGNRAGTFERVRQPVIRRVHACNDLDGGH